MDDIKIYNENCIDGMKRLDTDSVDLIVTDPPYGLKFMGKQWDKALPPKEAFEEMCRVLKPGAFAFVMCAPRSDLQARMSILLEDAGFDISFTPIYWTFATGFPKAQNMSKAIDKRAGAEREIIGDYKRPDGSNPRKNVKSDNALFGNADSNDQKITAPATEDAIKYDGAYAGFQPKPAVEVIIVAMKPKTEKTYVDQCLANGHGITYLDNCRIPINPNENLGKDTSLRNSEKTNKIYGKFETGPGKNVKRNANKDGRFPANLLVSDDSLNNGEITGAGITGSGIAKNNKSKDYDNSSYHINYQGTRGYADTGSYSRYFDLDAWFAIIPKPSKREKGEGNTHPTVKPLKLMSYLITLGSRPDEIILDPFMGSGTTGISALLIQRKFIGYEMEPEYYQIAKARIESYKKEVTLDEFN